MKNDNISDILLKEKQLFCDHTNTTNYMEVLPKSCIWGKCCLNCGLRTVFAETPRTKVYGEFREIDLDSPDYPERYIGKPIRRKFYLQN